MQSQRTLRGWLDREIIQTQDSTPPAELEWTCDVCGPQPAVSLANNRWVRRRCRCERERLAREAAQEKRARLAQDVQATAGEKPRRESKSLMPLSAVLAQRGGFVTPPPPELIWSCPKCGPIEPFILPSGRWIRRSCSCERKQREEREREALQATWRHDQLVRTFGRWLGAHWVDNTFIEKMATKTFDSYDLMRQPDAYEKAFAFAQAPQGNLLFWGEYGLGKTHLEAAICNYARDVGWRGPDGKLHPSGSIFVSAPQLFMAYQETRKAFDQTAHIRLMETLIGSPLLVIDDVDKRTPQKGDWDVYWMIFEARYAAARPTILSTNKLGELPRYIGEASLSRLSRGLVSVEMHGDDFRREEA